MPSSSPSWQHSPPPTEAVAARVDRGVAPAGLHCKAMHGQRIEVAGGRRDSHQPAA